MIIDGRGNTLFVNDIKIYSSRKSCDYKLVSLFPDTSSSFSYQPNTYQCNVKVVKDRLDILGFTLNAAAIDFDRSKAIAIDILDQMLGQKAFDVSYVLPFFLTDKDTIKNKDVIGALTFHAYKEALQQHIKKRCTNPYYQTLYPKSVVSLEGYIVESEKKLFGFLCSDERFFFRVLLNIFDDNDLISLRMPSSLDSNNSYLPELKKTFFRDCQKQDRIRDSVIIILSEGKTDVEILKPALHLLYPDVADLYSFFDFEPEIFATSKDGKRDIVNGSASMLAQIVKAFIAADINHRIIAIFDNDAAGLDASQYLRNNSNIPTNVKILTLPEFDALNSYPMKSDSIINGNINKHAASMEMYLGDDCLKDNGTFFPIIKGGDVGIFGWQGNLGGNKEEPRRRFNEKVEACKSNVEKINDSGYDWRGIRLIFRDIFSAFKDD